MIIGIDPGLDGAIAWINKFGYVMWYSMPTVEISKGKHEIDAVAVHHRLVNSEATDDVVVIEQIQPDPKWGVSRSGTMMKNYGMVLAVVKLLGMSHIMVKPQQWKAKMLAGTDKSKQAAVARVQQLYPQLDLRKPGSDKPSHDAAEAVLLALYGRNFAGGDA